MNSALKNFLIFAVGAAAGSAVTWKLIEAKYEQIAQEEIDSVKETYARRAEEALSILDEADKMFREYEENGTDSEKPDLKEYADKIASLGYNKSAEDEVEKPYVIDPEEFGDIDDYDTITLMYYADGILADDDDNIIEDVDGIVGSESLKHFGEYEDDSVCVRNDRLKCDYEILLDNERFADVVKTGPRTVED